MAKGRCILGACAVAAAVLLDGCVAGPAPETTADTASTLRIARAARAAGDYASAVNLYRMMGAGAAAAGNPAVKIEMADTLLQAGSIDEAITVYNSVPTASAAGLGAFLGLEHAYLMLDDVPKALAYADKAKALVPDDTRALVDRGVALDLAGRHDEAQASYRAVLAKEPSHRAARDDLALSLTLTGNYAEAAATVEPIARSSTATPRERQNLALTYGLMGNESEARRWSAFDLDQAATADNLRFFDYLKDRF